MITFPRKNRAFFSGFFIPLLFLCGCGYSFSGTQPLPGNVKEIFVSQVKDRVGEIGLSACLRDDLIYTLTRSRQANAANSPERAEAVLETEVRSVSEESLTRTAKDVDVERRLHMTAFFMLKRVDGTVLWQSSIHEKEDFKVGVDKAVTENLRKTALETLSQRMAERVLEQIGSTF